MFRGDTLRHGVMRFMADGVTRRATKPRRPSSPRLEPVVSPSDVRGSVLVVVAAVRTAGLPGLPHTRIRWRQPARPPKRQTPKEAPHRLLVGKGDIMIKLATAALMVAMSSSAFVQPTSPRTPATEKPIDNGPTSPGSNGAYQGRCRPARCAWNARTSAATHFFRPSARRIARGASSKVSQYPAI